MNDIPQTSLGRDILAPLAKTPLFTGLAEADLRLLLAEARVETFADGYRLYEQQGEAPSFFMLLDGHVELLHQEGGRLSVVEMATPPSLLGETAMFVEGRHPVAARVVGTARLLVIPAESFRRVVDDRFDLAQRMLRSMAVRLRGLVTQIAELKLKSTAQRLAGFLLGLTPQTAGRATVRFPYDKRRAADALGMTAESLSRALLRLGELGVVSHPDNRVDIPDLAMLRAFCGEEIP